MKTAPKPQAAKTKPQGMNSRRNVGASKPGKAPKEPAVVATSSANSGSADPDARHRSLDAPVGEVTRHI